MNRKKMMGAAIPIGLMILVLIAFRLFPRETGIKVITVKLSYENQIEKAYTFHTEADVLADALLEAPDGQEFDTVTAVYVNGEQSGYSLQEQPVQDGDEFVLTFDSSQLPKEE